MCDRSDGSRSNRLLSGDVLGHAETEDCWRLGVAETLKKMLDSGIAPPLYSEVEVRAYVASVLRRTAGVRDRDCDGVSD